MADWVKNLTVKYKYNHLIFSEHLQGFLQKKPPGVPQKCIPSILLVAIFAGIFKRLLLKFFYGEIPHSSLVLLTELLHKSLMNYSREIRGILTCFYWYSPRYFPKHSLKNCSEDTFRNGFTSFCSGIPGNQEFLLRDCNGISRRF